MATVNPFRFGGQFGYYTDASTRSYVRARHLLPYEGRWQSKDPVSVRKNADNLYYYVSNNPVTHVDPTGLFGVSADCGGNVSFVWRQVDTLCNKIRSIPKSDPRWTKLANCISCHKGGYWSDCQRDCLYNWCNNSGLVHCWYDSTCGGEDTGTDPNSGTCAYVKGGATCASPGAVNLCMLALWNPSGAFNAKCGICWPRVSQIEGSDAPCWYQGCQVYLSNTCSCISNDWNSGCETFQGTLLHELMHACGTIGEGCLSEQNADKKACCFLSIFNVRI
jgi:RHS repeat-associated protein